MSENLSQPKVYEFAKELGIETLVLMNKIREWKIPVKSHMQSLEQGVIEEIKTKLREETEGASTAAKKKAAVRKKEAASGTAKAAAPKSTAAKAAGPAKPIAPAKAVPPAIRKVVTKAASPEPESVEEEVSSALETNPAEEQNEAKPTLAAKSPQPKMVVPAQPAKPLTGARVIRRKSGAGAESEIPSPGMGAPESAGLENSNFSLNTMGTVAAGQPGAHENEAEVGKISAEPIAAVKDVKTRGNIIGRMDLSRVTPPEGAQGNVRGLRSVGPKNIRTGFVAPSLIEDPVVESEKEKALKKKAGTGKEEAPATFTATEFRKREVIFQAKKKKTVSAHNLKKTELTTPAAHKRIVKVNQVIKVSDFAVQLGIKAPVLIKKLMGLGVMASMSSDIDFDTVTLIAPDFGFEAQNVKITADDLVLESAFGDLTAEPVFRAPVVTVMGHVDHGKTSLLDAIRKSDVASKEAGGITQHIGAYRVQLEEGQAVTFIDTPGHEAFTSMRARGANVTDVAIIVVAADDGLMPQTAEAINHAKAAGVPIIVAVNKMDKHGANVEKVKQQLMEFELVPEEWGGTTIYCPVSALKGTGIKELLEQVALNSEVLELKANPARSALGTVIESRIERGRGSVATLLVQDGTVRVGDSIVAGTAYGRVRAMLNDKGEPIKEAGPSVPVEVSGFQNTPEAGDKFFVCKDESYAIKIAEIRRQDIELKAKAAAAANPEDIFAKLKKGDVQTLPIILKADVAGSAEAVKAMLEKLSTSEVKVKILHTAVGGITENDVLLASTAGGLVLGFNVRPDTTSQKLGKEKNVQIQTYSIIYELVDEMKKAMAGLLQPTIVEKVLGRVSVREVFNIPKVGAIAGCSVTDGKILRSAMLRLLRGGIVVYTGKVSSLKRFKEDVKEVLTGYECGIGIENFNDIKVGDEIEAFQREEVAREL